MLFAFNARFVGFASVPLPTAGNVRSAVAVLAVSPEPDVALTVTVTSLAFTVVGSPVIAPVLVFRFSPPGSLAVEVTE